jgi:DNA-binding beta-propeller fold protein YncE
MRGMFKPRVLLFAIVTFVIATCCSVSPAATPERRLLYVATPGIRDDLQYGGHGILVFDIDHGHKFVKRIASGGLDEKGKPLNVKGICASSKTGRLYVSTTRTLSCMDLRSEKWLWEKAYEKGCDRMALSPDAKFIYLPSFENDHWNVVDARDGEVIKKIVTHSGSHNTVIGLDGKFAYLAGLKSPFLRVSDTKKHEVVREIGPFSNVVRPFTVNGEQTRCYVNVNDLLGFEIGDLKTGKVLNKIEVTGFSKGPVKRHGCPCHGIGMTPDENEIWLADSANQRIHIFDNRVDPPKQVESIAVRDQPGWVTFSIDGTIAYPSTGDVVDVKSRKIIAELADETGAAVQSEKLLEIDFLNGKPVRAGNQFGLGSQTASRTDNP